MRDVILIGLTPADCYDHLSPLKLCNQFSRWRSQAVYI